MPEIKSNQGDGIMLLKFVGTFIVAWLLMLTEARVNKDTGLFGGNLSYIASLGIVGVFVLMALIVKPAKGVMRS